MAEEDPLSTIAAVLGKLEERTKNTRGEVAEVKEEQENHGNRIGALEKWQQRILGAAALLGLMSPLFVLGIRENIFELFR